MYNYLIMFLSSLIISLILTPIAKKLAYYLEAVDHPNHRKVHEEIMPRLGGVAIYLAFLINCLVFIELVPSVKAILLGSIIIVFVGIIDDLKGLSAIAKLSGQIIAVIPILIYGLQNNFFGGFFANAIWANYLVIPLTVLWIVGLVNAVNLIDGLDGLAGGISIISAASIVVISAIQGTPISLGLGLILAASTLGFLNYNFNPAQIFMGDTGSMFLGYSLATISLIGMVKSATIITVFTPVLVVGVPILDTSLAFFRRLLNGNSPFKADKNHLHHRFLNFGLNEKQTVLTIYLVTIIFGMLAVILTKYHNIIALVTASSILGILFFWLKEFEIIGVKPVEEEEPIELLKEIRYDLVELEVAIDKNLKAPKSHAEIDKLEELVEKVPKFVYSKAYEAATIEKEKQAYASLQEKIILLIEIIDCIIDNYESHSNNLNYIFKEEKENLISIYNGLKDNLNQNVVETVRG